MDKLGFKSKDQSGDSNTIDKISDNKTNNFNALTAYAALASITIIRTAAYWQQKSIGYFYGFKASADQIDKSFYEVSSAYP